MQPVLRRRDDAGLVLAAEGVRRRAARPAVVLAVGEPAGRKNADSPGGGSAAAEEPSTRDPWGQETTAAVSFESGSLSASTAFDRALISSGVRSV